MFEVKTGNILSPMVKTSVDGGLSMEALSEACVSKIISVSETASPEIKEQVYFFQDKLQNLIYQFLKNAAKSERDTCIQLCIRGGEENAANLLRRL